MSREKSLTFTLQPAPEAHGLVVAASPDVYGGAKEHFAAFDYAACVLAGQGVITVESGAPDEFRFAINERVIGGKTRSGRPEHLRQMNEVLGALAAAAADESAIPEPGAVRLDAFEELPSGDFSIIARLQLASGMGGEALGAFAQEQMRTSARLLRSGQEGDIGVAVDGQQVELGFGLDANLHTLGYEPGEDPV